MYAVACLNNAALLHAAQFMMHAAVCCIQCCASNPISLHSTLDIAFQPLHICSSPVRLAVPHQILRAMSKSDRIEGLSQVSVLSVLGC